MASTTKTETFCTVSHGDGKTGRYVQTITTRDDWRFMPGIGQVNFGNVHLGRLRYVPDPTKDD